MNFFNGLFGHQEAWCMNSLWVTSLIVTGADPGFFLGGGALVYCSISIPINHIVFFFLRNTSCIRKSQVISGGEGGAHPLHHPPRSAPAWFGISASSVIFKLREFSSDHLAPSLIFFHLQSYYDSLPYLKHMLRAQDIGMSLATVTCECSLNHWFSTSLFVSLFVYTGRHNKYLWA